MAAASIKPNCAGIQRWHFLQLSSPSVMRTNDVTACFAMCVSVFFLFFFLDDYSQSLSLSGDFIQVFSLKL